MVYEDNDFYIEREQAQVPWIIIYAKGGYKELSELSRDKRIKILDILDVIEKEMLSYYKPDKINIATFGNYLPKVHFHIMARFEEDTHFPETMWGKEQREDILQLPSFEIFCDRLSQVLDENFSPKNQKIA